jgi:O-antigen/teichoic acid export membrane protein
MSPLSLKKLALRGAVWIFAGYGTSQVLRFFGNLILTRLLVPEFFGLMALINTLRIGLELFSDFGIGQSIIQNKRGDTPEFLNTAWTLKIIRGVVLWLVSLLLTVPIARFYEDERLLWLVPIVSLTTVIDGFCSTSMTMLNRRMNLGKLTIFDLSVQVFSLAVITIWAWISPTIWALALGSLAGPLFRTIVSHTLLPDGSNRLAWDKSVIAEIASFGRWMFVATAVMFLAEQSDRLILGKLLPFELLGVYTIAYTLASIPREVIKRLGFRVVFPAVSKQADLPRSTLREKILRQRRLPLIGLAIFLALLVSFGDLIIDSLYDERYDQATWMMPILCTGVWFSILHYTENPLLLAIGKPLYSAQSNLIRFLMIGIGLPLGFSSMGILGAVIIISLSDLPLYLVNLYGLVREKLACVLQDLQATALFIGVLTLILFVRSMLGFGLPINALF